MRQSAWVAIVLLSSKLALGQVSAAGDYTKLAVRDDYVVQNFKFHTGEQLPELRQHYVTWGTAQRNAAARSATRFYFYMEPWAQEFTGAIQRQRAQPRIPCWALAAPWTPANITSLLPTRLVQISRQSQATVCG